MAQHNELGRRGEDYATSFLLSKGYGILDRNWHSGHKEIDIIAQDGAEIVFVEVKARTNEDLSFASDAVDRKKQQLLIYAAETYIKSHQLNLSPRFDIITVVGKEDDPTVEIHIDHIIDAYRAPMTTTRKFRSLR